MSSGTKQQQAAPASDDARRRAGAARNSEYVRGARILSFGIISAGILTFAYFSIASHVLGEVDAKRLDLLWSVMFVIISVIYRPTEQLLSRTIAGHRARGTETGNLRAAIKIQAAFAAVFLVAAAVLHEFLVNEVFEGDKFLYWVLVVGTLLYAGSYFARGWLAGHERFDLYGALLILESVSRVCFVLIAVIGITHGESAVAIGIAAAPFISMIVVPAAFRRRRNVSLERDLAAAPITLDEADAALAGPGTEGAQEATHDEGLTFRRGSTFAAAVAGIMLSEQALLNGSVLTVDVTAANVALAGVVFNVMLIARAPLQAFQAIQTSLLPHLTGLEATDGHEAFAKAIRVTLIAIAGFAAAVALGLLVLGPFVLGHVFGQKHHYSAVGLAILGIGMGFHLASGALNQAALARDRPRIAGAFWVFAAVAFLVWMFVPIVSEELLRAETGYALATALLASLLFVLYRFTTPSTAAASSA